MWLDEIIETHLEEPARKIKTCSFKQYLGVIEDFDYARLKYLVKFYKTKVFSEWFRWINYDMKIQLETCRDI